jgi:hypothetical protein
MRGRHETALIGIVAGCPARASAHTAKCVWKRSWVGSTNRGGRCRLKEIVDKEQMTAGRGQMLKPTHKRSSGEKENIASGPFEHGTIPGYHPHVH